MFHQLPFTFSGSGRVRRFLPFMPTVAIAVYFAAQAWSGDNGLAASHEYERQIASLKVEVASLQQEEAQWQDRAARLREASIDLDYLDERARALTGFADYRDVIIPAVD